MNTFSEYLDYSLDFITESLEGHLTPEDFQDLEESLGNLSSLSAAH